MTKTYIIAEAGVNHNGNEAVAMQLVDIAKRAGADAVKFQMFAPELLTTSTAKTAGYQAQNLGDNKISQQDMLRALTLPDEAYVRLAEYCVTQNIDFLCTPFDSRSLAYLLQNTRMKFLKIPSGEVTNLPFLAEVGASGLPIILSTGMSNLEEIDAALGAIAHGIKHGAKAFEIPPAPLTKSASLHDHVSLLHCVSQYPAPIDATNLRAMHTMRERFCLSIGMSDHSEGIAVSIAAVALGASIIEKHFTHDKHAQGPDHAASLNEEELVAMITGIRQVEQALGISEKKCQPIEKSTRDIARKSLVALTPIAQGELFSTKNLTCKRPSIGGQAPGLWWNVLGKTATRDYNTDDFIEPA